MWSLPLRLPLHRAARSLGRAGPLPSNLAFNLLYACNSRCVTCNVYERKVRPLDVDEFDRIFRSLGRAPVWVTLTGGEPFLRKDVVAIAQALHARCRPSLVTIASNGTFPERVVPQVDEIVRAAPRTRWIVNLSLDEIGERHDAIRRTPGNWRLTLETLRGLRALRAANLTVGIHTCISRFNAERFDEIQDGLAALGADSLIAELAEDRAELRNDSAAFAPLPALYRRAVERLVSDLLARRASGIPRLIRALRLRYYDFTLEQLASGKQAVPCLAGWASAHVGADGEVWTCSTRAEPLGRLRELDYDFRRAWHSTRARELRASIRRGDCACPMASAAYTSLLGDPRSLARIALGWLGGARRPAAPRPDSR